METSVYKATRHDRTAPKKKHLDALCSYSWESKVTIKNMLDLLCDRAHSNSWTVVFKCLIVYHVLMREGCSENVFNYITQSPSLLNVGNFKPKAGSSGILQAKNIRTYAVYLEDKALVYKKLKVDFAENKTEFAMKLMYTTVAKGLLRHIEVLQDHIEILISTKYHEVDIDNDITLLAFKLLVRDCMKLFQAVNQGVMTLLKQYFSMDKPSATKALEIYRNFSTQTEKVVEYLNVARNVQAYLGFAVPNLKHAPLSLAESLEEYLNSPDAFDALRQPTIPVTVQSPNLNQPRNQANIAATPFPVPANNNNNNRQQKKEIVDFFASIEDEQAMINYQPSLPTFSPPTSHNNNNNNNNNNNPFSTMPTTSIHPINSNSSMQSSNPFTSNPFSTNTMSNQSGHNPFMTQQLQAQLPYSTNTINGNLFSTTNQSAMNHSNNSNSNSNIMMMMDNNHTNLHPFQSMPSRNAKTQFTSNIAQQSPFF